MHDNTPIRGAIRRLPLVRMAGAALALAGLSASALAVGPAAASTVLVSTTKNTPAGTVLESGGATLYTLKASSTPCTAACLAVWPAFDLPKGQTKVKVAKGVQRSKFGTVKRSGHVVQVTYKGKPLYKFIGDHAAGDVNGNITDTWGKWTAVVISKSNAVPAQTTTTGGGGPAF